MEQESGVIFDVDGVLVDSYQAHFDSWQVVARQHGFQFTERIFIDTFGRTTREILRGLPDVSLTLEAVAQIDADKEAVFRDLLVVDFPAMDGAAELIDELAEAGYRLAVGSSGPPENVELVLDSLNRRSAFQAAVSGMDVTQGKPHPQVFLTAAERLGLPPHRCVVIEDAPAGVEAAVRAGTQCIGFASRGHTFAELHRAHLRVASLRAVSRSLVANLLNGQR